MFGGGLGRNQEKRNVTSAMSPGAGTEEGLARLRLGPKQPNPESDQRDEQAPRQLGTVWFGGAEKLVL